MRKEEYWNIRSIVGDLWTELMMQKIFMWIRSCTHASGMYIGSTGPEGYTIYYGRSLIMQ